MASRYQLDLQPLSEAYRRENEQYSYRSAWQGLVAEHAQVGAAQALLDVDMRTVSSMQGRTPRRGTDRHPGLRSTPDARTP